MLASNSCLLNLKYPFALFEMFVRTRLSFLAIPLTCFPPNCLSTATAAVAATVSISNLFCHCLQLHQRCYRAVLKRWVLASMNDANAQHSGSLVVFVLKSSHLCNQWQEQRGREKEEAAAATRLEGWLARVKASEQTQSHLLFGAASSLGVVPMPVQAEAKCFHSPSNPAHIKRQAKTPR